MGMKYSSRILPKTEYKQIAKNYYAVRSEWALMTDAARHLDMCDCVSNRRRQPMFTGQSACAMRGIARLDAFEMRPYCISDRRKRTDDFVVWNYGPLDPNATIERGRLAAGPIRTVFDLAKFDSPESLLVSINDCLYKKMFTKKWFVREMEKRPGMKGTKLLGQLLRLATPECESPLETIAWTAIYKAGFRMPLQQVKIYDDDKFVGRVDMYWKVRRRRIVLELDGKVKYTGAETDALYKEKKREDALREMKYDVIRATWEDVISGDLAKMLHKRKIPMRRDSARSFPTKKT
jgi:very-short-patch-repair endonuclease